MKLNLKPLIRSLGGSLEKHAPEFLVSVGIAGLFGSIVLAVKATPKAMDDIAEAAAKKADTSNDGLTKMEVVKATWKNYIPAAATALGSAGCIIAGTTVSLRRGTAIATAYKLSEEAFREYKEATVDVVGKDKEKEIRAHVAEKKIQTTPIDDNNIFMTGKGSDLCFEPITGRYFWSNSNAIDHDINLFNARLIDDGEASLNDFFEFLGLKTVSEIIGDNLCWRYSGRGLSDLCEISYKPVMTENRGTALALVYDNPPRYRDPHIYSSW